MSNQIENREANFKQIRIKKIAFFKNNMLDNLVYGKTEVIFSLKFNQSIQSNIL